MKNVLVGALLQPNEEACGYDNVEKQQNQESNVAALQKQQVSSSINDDVEWAKLRSELKKNNPVTSTAVKQTMLNRALRKNDAKKNNNNKNHHHDGDHEDNEQTNIPARSDHHQATEKIRRRLSSNKVDESFKKSLRNLKMSGTGSSAASGPSLSDSMSCLAETRTNSNDVDASSHCCKEEVLSTLPLKKIDDKKKDTSSAQVAIDNGLDCVKKSRPSSLRDSFGCMLNPESLSSECLSDWTWTPLVSNLNATRNKVTVTML